MFTVKAHVWGCYDVDTLINFPDKDLISIDSDSYYLSTIDKNVKICIWDHKFSNQSKQLHDFHM